MHLNPKLVCPMSNIVSVAGNGAAERCAIGDYLLALSHRSVDDTWHREELTLDVIDNRFALMFAISAAPSVCFAMSAIAFP